MNQNTSEFLVQNTRGITFAVNSSESVSSIEFNNGWRAQSIISHNPNAKVVAGSLLSLNEPNNILGVTKTGNLFVVYFENNVFVSNTFKPQGWNDLYKVIPKTLNYSIVEGITYGVLVDASILSSINEKLIDEKLKLIFMESKMINDTAFQKTLNKNEFQQMGQYTMSHGKNPTLLSYSLKIKILIYLFNKGFDLSKYFEIRNRVFYLYWSNNNWIMGLINQSVSASIEPNTFKIADNGITLQYINTGGDLCSTWEGDSNNLATVIKPGLSKIFASFDDPLFTSIDWQSRVLKVN